MTIWVSFTPLWACICFATCWLPYRKRYYIVSRWNVFTIWLLKSICGIRYQVKGMENLPDEPVILLSKHQSAWETIFLLCHMPRPLSFVLKKELLYIPFFWLGTGTSAHDTHQSQTGHERIPPARQKGSQRLKENLWIIIFPKERGYRSARKENTTTADPDWRSKPEQPSSPLPSTPENAGPKTHSSKNPA